MMRRTVCALAVVGATVAAPVSVGHAAGPHAEAAVKLHAGEFCSRHKQRYYHRHGYTCRRAGDGRNRLFTY
jgi:hypothetical protein